MKLTAFYQLSLCAAVASASPIAAAGPPSPRARFDDAGQARHAGGKRQRVGTANELGAGKATEGKSQSSSVKAPSIPSAVAPVRHKVAAGETLGEIAKRAGTSVEVLSAINSLGKRQPLRIGQLLVLPGVAQSPRKSWHVYARPPKKPGFLEVSTHSSEFSGQALAPDGRLRLETVRALNNLLGASGPHPALPERLLRLLVEVSDTFGGRPIRLVSGYRTTSFFEDSRHKLSSAIDFLVVGVPNAVVCEYLREIEDVGVGYYPNSSFVHLDVRDHSAYWVDYAGPGEPPRSTPNAPPARPSSRPVRPADRKLVAALDRVLQETQRGLEKVRATTQAATPTAAKPERERRADSSATAQAQPASKAAFDELALSVAEPDPATDSR